MTRLCSGSNVSQLHDPACLVLADPIESMEDPSPRNHEEGWEDDNLSAQYHWPHELGFKDQAIDDEGLSRESYAEPPCWDVVDPLPELMFLGDLNSHR